MNTNHLWKADLERLHQSAHADVIAEIQKRRAERAEREDSMKRTALNQRRIADSAQSNPSLSIQTTNLYVQRLANTLSVMTLKTLCRRLARPRDPFEIERTTISRSLGVDTIQDVEVLKVLATQALQQKTDTQRRLPQSRRSPSLEALIQRKAKRDARSSVFPVQEKPLHPHKSSSRSSPRKTVAVIGKITQGAKSDRVCVVCGCTDTDCAQCIARTGKPCEWDPAFTKASVCTACTAIHYVVTIATSYAKAALGNTTHLDVPELARAWNYAVRIGNLPRAQLIENRIQELEAKGKA